MLWILFTLFACCMQAVRTATQKGLTQQLGKLTVTSARYVFGLPFALVYLYAVLEFAQVEFQSILIPEKFYWLTALSSICQIVATIIMLELFDRSNFAVGSIFAKTEAIQVGIWGAIIFGHEFSILVWIGILLGFIGIIFMSDFSLKKLESKSIFAALGCFTGLLFAICALTLREASLSLDTNLLVSVALTLSCMCIMQICMLGIIGLVTSKPWILPFWQNPLGAISIGLTSTLGSIGWFSAMTLQLPALVKALAQVEVLLTLGISHLIFRESIKKTEYLGIVLTIVSVLLVLVASF